jgi:sigma-B regulation protein RsbU (phosphoserine phosphatase)
MHFIPARGSEVFDDYLAFIVSITQDFATSLDIRETLNTAVERIMAYVEAEAASIFLEEDGKLVCRACAGPIDITGLRLGVTQGIVGRTVRDNASFMVRDVRNDPDFAKSVDQSTGFVTRSILSAPLRVQDSCIGAVELINKRGGDGLFDERDGQLLTVLASSAGLAIHNARMAGALVEQERMRRELELAREIQRSLLPSEAEPGCSLVTGLNLPAREVSGDSFDYFSLADGRIAFNIADVAGKGMDAALLMAKTSSLLRCLGKTIASPGMLLARVNEEVCETATRGKFVTVVAGVYDPGTGAVALANAGHPPALLRDPDGSYREFAAGAPPLGIIPGMLFPEQEMSLGGGSLYLFTDGVTEVTDDQGRMLGVEGVKTYIDRAAALPADLRLEGIARSIAESYGTPNDDLTLLVVESAASVPGPSSG